MAGTITAGGLASGLDTGAIIESLVQIESGPLAKLKARQGAVKLQISALADIAARLAALKSATRSLADGGALALSAASANTAFSAAPASSAVAGTYAVAVQRLATSARALSAAFAAGEVVTGGTLHVAARGATWDVAVADGATLSDVAFAIRQSGAPVSAAVLDDGTSKYLSLTAKSSGYPLGGAPGDALALAFDATGVAGKLPAFAVTAPVNARLTVDGVTFQRESNTVTDAVPGATLTLRSLSAGVAPDATGGTPEGLVLQNDAPSTQSRLQTFVDAYNAVMALVQRQLAVTDKTDRSQTLAGDASVRSLQGRLQSLVSAAVGGLGSVRSLADLGVRTGRDGSLSIDSATLSTAIAADAAAVNDVFATAGTGVSALATSLADAFTRTGDGLLVQRQDGLGAQVRRMEDEAAALQKRIDAYRASLVRQFTAMETIVSQMKGIGSFLASQAR
ncbi:MAG TPA: flagellar filament capping protein FliD [Anaeromyxobacteraceae bacterium]|jgi:flagellar hook-associated protein 2